ncbi:Asp-tRNA(Asn)/Glu-tRNA(Gln) amidotransferase subunit GatB [Candidatus Methanosphaera massiliense]|jgi:aspartyl-tRNA(Asn)/glutamyl-tRNA(Gln) amidotransferase subunit B|uniref:Asp-tRNA(Asn)/Glu-tRNA(Gln) amidotransferase subunit GatB n=1 Tax=Methanosphaera TaxID=2316 RepID=UPI0023804FC0|nr:Asp-tRNA(Asn)/Glu-tRNA(Gln) amidotransferase subunit GatB [Candidatus Methanosphaera massiliense]MDD6285294.1 Asp-tRNA(Asn)/Glu-tRNA(Gln) amidotransferase subunit GatB [Methanobacteriaceae archaeon]MDE4078235.1 Asp-tRNA(Asn)/Glu-tRNA(Gln) amidotransferase subunit GatB [Candidatus Methanosphaera massiliense]MDY2744051.1 Asp-tRNA(Asn)/Glu-tRNA(Gln) amidotransferase subunit GatB [Methanosphaera sp.]
MMCGLEIHVQLNTNSKLFCSCPTNYQSAANNTNICPVCLNQPGAKPYPPNQAALDNAIKVALMLGCEISDEIIYFMRKHYDYPDLSSGYQRTSVPVGIKGELNGVRIHEIHVEEDPGQYKPDRGTVDFNRSGIPLIEIVTEPDMKSPEEARSFLNELIRVLEYSGSARGEGTMRADVNISIEGGKRAEVKNVNSIKGAYKVLKFELIRQKNILRRGGEVQQETRAYLESQMITVPMRLKEDADDYRYIPDPDLPPLKIDPAHVEEIRENMPEPAHLKTARFVEEYGIDEADAKVLTSELELADAFEEVCKEVDPNTAARLMRDELKRVLHYNKIRYAESKITPSDIVELINLIESKQVTPEAAHKLIEQMPNNDKTPTEIGKEMDIIGVVEDDAIAQAIDQAINENPNAVEDYKNGKENAVNFLVGQVMRLTRGKANAGETNKMIRDKLNQL